jgi:hypothetical protein
LRPGVVKELSGQAQEEGESVANGLGTPDRYHNAVETSPPKLEPETGDGQAGSKSSNVFNNMVPPMEKDFGTLVISEKGRSRYVSHDFWTRVTEEVQILHIVSC